MNTSFIHIPQHGSGTNRQYKTSLCRHFEYGNCSIGDKCQFAHGLAELRKFNDPLPNHVPKIEPNLVISNYKTVLCKYNESGFCKNGNGCPYAHGPSEKQRAQIAKVALQAQNLVKEEQSKQQNKILKIEPNGQQLKSSLDSTQFLINFVKELEEVEFERKEQLKSLFDEIIFLAKENNHKFATEKIIQLIKNRSELEKYEYCQIYQKFSKKIVE